ncbi:NUDIX hydrolase [Paracoccus albus]|uniref:NUDIX hydrolase n=1 Tax=Paracoccus albus TaxID=3017784 RepID=UPI0022EFFA5D|nr:NUDIX domain-containing protein [Paracoccus albus]WBU61767.1 NUDIX domain-containing protein [Paracoccus albus]
MDIHIAAAVVVRSDGATLLVRKRGTNAFMQPGGKIDSGEAPLVALYRELAEELAMQPADGSATYIGRFEAVAANEENKRVIAELYRLETEGDFTAQSEIEEVRWILPEETEEFILAPLTRDHVLPAIWGARAS